MALGLFTTVALELTATFSNGTGLTATQIGYGDASNKVAGSSKLTFIAASGLTIINHNATAAATAIGTDTQLQLIGANAANSRLELDAYGTSVAGVLSGRVARNTQASPQAVQNNDVLLRLSAYGYGATAFSTALRASVEMAASETWTDAAHGTKLLFKTTVPTTTTTATRLTLTDVSATFTGSVVADSLSLTNPVTVSNGGIGANTLPTGQVLVGAATSSPSGNPGFAVTGTPSATAPSAASNGPGSSAGPVYQGADGALANYFIPASFGNGTACSSGVLGYVSQGTAASPGAVTALDNVGINMRGYDGTAWSANAASVQLAAGSTWSNTSHESYVQFRTVASGSTTSTAAGRFDGNQTLVLGGAFNGVATFTAGTQRPHLQTAATTVSNCNVAQSLWANSINGPTGIFAKSRSATVGTQGVITTGDTLGTMSWQGDDGTNFIQAASLVAIAEGTIATGQVPGRLRVLTASSAGTSTQAGFVDSSQVWGLTTSTAAPSALYAGGTVTPRLQIGGTTTGTGSSATVMHSANAVGPSLYLSKSRSATIFTGMTLLSANDVLGTLDFQGADGTNFVSAAQIIGTATGTPASTRMGGSITFKTGTDAAPTVMTTALTLDNTQGATFAGQITLTDAKNIVCGSSTGNIIGTAITQKIGFYNAAPIAQRSGAAQAAVVTTAAALASYGYVTQAQADGIVTLVNELRAWAVSQGFIKGSA